MISGNIPEKITFVSRGSEEVETYTGRTYEVSENSRKELVVPVFISDAKNKKTLETARRWAEQLRFSHPNQPIKEETQENTPFMGPRLVQLEHRGNGGVAYKVVLPSGYWVDLREDILMDIMLNSSVEQGVLQGEYVFAKVGAEMKLIRVSSELYDQLSANKTKQEAPKIKASDLEIGARYSKKSYGTATYLGRYSIIKYKLLADGEEIQYHALRNRKLSIDKEIVKNLFVFTGATEQTTSRHMLNDISFTKQHAYIKKESEISAPRLPDNFLDVMKKLAIEVLNNVPTFTYTSEIYHYLDYLSTISAVPNGQEPVETPEMLAFLKKVISSFPEIEKRAGRGYY